MTQNDSLNSEKKLAHLLKALGSPLRLRILDALGKGQPATLGEITLRLTPQPPATSLLSHLRVLRTCGLVQAEKSGARMLYSVDPREFGKALGVLKGFARPGE